MKRTFIFIAILMYATVGKTQEISFSESWLGKVDIGNQKLNIGFTIKTLSDGKQICTMDVPDQGAKDIPAKLIKNDADSLSIYIATLNATYKGFKSSNKSIEGIFIQNDIRLALKLESGKFELKRPQNPQPPFKYATEEIVFKNEAEGAVLSGTLTYPINFENYPQGSVPVVLMITGSGSQNRDEEIFNHKPFLVIADFLAKHGIASLRYDDRGVGNSTGPIKGITTMNNVADAKSGISYLRSLNKFGKIGVLGHSEGGTIAFIMGADKSVDFLVSLAGSAAKGIDVIIGQNKAAMQLQGIPEQLVNDYAKALKMVFEIRISGKEIADEAQYVSDLCNTNNLVLPDNFKSNLVKCMTFGGEWLTWFLGYNPVEAIRKITCPVMALNGNIDCQVLSEDNLSVIKTNLPSNDMNMIKEYDGLNHLFQHATLATSLSYGTIEETISNEVLYDIADWINKIK